MSQLRIVVAALVVAGVIAGIAAQYWLHSPIDALGEEQVFEVREGASLRAVANELAERGLVNWPRVFSAWGRVTGQAENIKVGEYLLAAGISPSELLAQLVAGKVKLYPVTIVEGWTSRELFAALAENPAVTNTLGNPIDTDSGALPDLLQAGHPEGQYFPDTYMVSRGTRDAVILQQANELMQEKLAAAWEDRADGLPFKDPYELLILASIVERETGVDSERAQVAGVFIRRLKKGMRLQTDPTVIYGLGEAFDGNLTRNHLLTDNPYNTYTRNGLPPTPIALPGESSLQATAHPDDGKALYFVASGDPDGTHVFSATLAEHNAAVAAYIARLRQASRKARGSPE
ncbi:MAG: endolytic transglycosylase MltG [Gammaproteobacteria bacterium]|jgi:UPF0755 protein|nr:endolytic transglycosylase MltG [Gammaproteobacteria bacterium]MDP6617671.1 endolytic transglycosylase MltG [Gammaproteobacteria bacterium]MDP6694964.1 endolytic transglycosylase MltG [Gammaproteobacteria bacterium]MDP7041495.1 endolytic transglycosylase MltG [Gammaproteobacteria bacterium]